MKARDKAYNKAVKTLFGPDSDETISFHFQKDSDSYSEQVTNFKRLFNSGDKELQMAAWNCISIWTFDDGMKDDFTEEESRFIQDYIYCDKHWINCRTENLNAGFSSSRLILRPADDEHDLVLYRSHLKKDGDFKIYTGKKLTRDNLTLYDLNRPLCFCIFEKATGNMVGITGLYSYNNERRIATAEWYIFKPYRGKGYAKEAITALAARAFAGKLFEMRETAWRNQFRRHYVKIDMIRADIREKNIPSQKTAESCGFVYQYSDHRHYVIEGEGLEDGKIYELTPKTLIQP
jgi:RimJ/RimL family protein N-acetyltransferase